MGGKHITYINKSTKTNVNYLRDDEKSGKFLKFQVNSYFGLNGGLKYIGVYGLNVKGFASRCCYCLLFFQCFCSRFPVLCYKQQRLPEITKYS